MDNTTNENWWRRVPASEDGFTYLKVDGTPLRSKAARSRIDALAIPPGWTDVHISPDAHRKVQAWGRDDAGRKQYIYSEEHIRRRDRKKWSHVLDFARLLPELRAATNRDLKRDGVEREKVLAAVVRLMGRAYFRPGGERYAAENDTFGICTVRERHLEVRGNDLVFRYAGKGSRDQRRVVAETPLVEIIEQVRELPGKRLFRYRYDGEACNVTAGDVNRYIQGILGEDYSAKDLRTFGGTVRAATILADIGPAEDERQAHSNTVMCCRLVASELGNTPAIARESYIHPAVFEQYEEHGRTIAPLMRTEPRPVAAEAPVDYYPEEAALMRFLERYG